MAIATPLSLEGGPFTPAQRGWLGSLLNEALSLEHATSIAGVTPPMAAPAFDRRSPLAAERLDVRPLTKSGSQKDVCFVALDLRGGQAYSAGDSLGVYPENCPALV